MADKDAAQQAWRALVYKQFGGSVLYLEKAPASIWAGGAPKASTDDKSILPVAAAPGKKDGAATGGTEADAAPGATLFLKNLSFATTTPRLRAAFDHLDGFVFARVQTKPDPKRQGETLSMGFGFAGFRTPAHAQRAKEAQAGLVLDGHEVEINFAKRDTDKVGQGRNGTTTTTATTKESSTKLLVKNVPFEATRNDLRQLFGYAASFSVSTVRRRTDFHLVCTQRLRSTQVGPLASQDGQQDARFRLPRVCDSPRRRSRFRGPRAHSLARSSLGPAVHRG